MASAIDEECRRPVDAASNATLKILADLIAYPFWGGCAPKRSARSRRKPTALAPCATHPLGV
jgi:hypothetical protein